MSLTSPLSPARRPGSNPQQHSSPLLIVPCGRSSHTSPQMAAATSLPTGIDSCTPTNMLSANKIGGRRPPIVQIPRPAHPRWHRQVLDQSQTVWERDDCESGNHAAPCSARRTARVHHEWRRKRIETSQVLLASDTGRPTAIESAALSVICPAESSWGTVVCRESQRHVLHWDRVACLRDMLRP